ncbi:colicin immunity domain-containing protein [Rahnella victoriana]|uniref:Colicin-D n=1 Tax=Rahnella victoriana TaxID=1510570 RepID=A0ABS0DVF0_9GAMM|nr:colicin immunity domain-containing protein [Rahnella victoriana]MBF7957856.1 colicin-D [Rahnella victoriana]
MSMTLIDFAKQFAESTLNADNFADEYIRLWKVERDSNNQEKDTDIVSECCSSIFVVADCYNPEADRDDYELDEATLRIEVKALLEKSNLL